MTATAMHYLPNLEEHFLEGLLAKWQAAHPLMGVLALLPEAERDSIARVQQGCARRHIPVFGALFPALIEGGAFHTSGAWLLRFDEMPYAVLFDAMVLNIATLLDELYLRLANRVHYMGANAYIVKSRFDQSKLLEIIQRLL